MHNLQYFLNHKVLFLPDKDGNKFRLSVFIKQLLPAIEEFDDSYLYFTLILEGFIRDNKIYAELLNEDNVCLNKYEIPFPYEVNDVVNNGRDRILEAISEFINTNR